MGVPPNLRGDGQRVLGERPLPRSLPPRPPPPPATPAFTTWLCCAALGHGSTRTPPGSTCTPGSRPLLLPRLSSSGSHKPPPEGKIAPTRPCIHQPEGGG